MKISKIASYLLSIMLVILLGIGVSGCMSEQEEILSYLEDKYGEKFEVVRYWSESNGTSLLSHKMMVHPTGKPELLFKTGKFWDPIKRKVVYWDSYVPTHWSIEYTQKTQSELTSMINRDSEIKYRITIPVQVESKYLQLGMEDYVQENKTDEFSPTAIVGIAIKCDKVPDKNEEAILIYRIYQKLQKLGFKRLRAHVIFVKANVFHQEKELLQMYHADSQISLTDIGPQNYYYDVLINNQETTVRTPDDIVSLFKSGE